MMDEAISETHQTPKNKLKAGWELLKLTVGEWTNDNTFEMAAALAFYTMFSIAPRAAHCSGRGQFFSGAGRGHESDR
jgi:uncharacterized BrkB/YihY/UPF0761 family membrane protein